ncbi:MAG: lipid II flippase MurJ [Ginsengibacter sp.]
MYFKKIFGLSGLRIVYAILGLTYSILQVRFFGTSRMVEVFFVANAVAYLVISLTQSGQLSEFFLPVYLSIKSKQGKEAAHRAFSVLINRFAIFLFLILIVFYFISPIIVSLMAPGFSKTDKELCVQMFRVFLIFMELQFINSFIDVTLNAEKIFGRIEWAAILNSIISLVLLILFYKTLGIWVLVLTLFVGKLVEFIITILFVRKVGIKYSFIWAESSFDARSFFKLMFTTSGYVLATQIYSMIFTAMATLLPQGTYAIFNYVQQISIKASGILLAPLSTVFFSHFSEHVASGKKELESKMKDPVLYSFMLGFIFTCFVVLLGREIIDVLWKSKTVSDYFLGIGYWMLIINFIGFTITGVGSIYRKVVVSLNRGKELYHFWIGVQIVNAILAYFIITPLGWFGLSLMTIIGYIFMATGSVWVAKKSGILIVKTFNSKRLVSLSLSTLFFIAFSFALNYFLKSGNHLFLHIILKLCIAFFMGFLLLYFRHKELYYKLLFFVKPILFKLNGSKI